VIRRTQTCPARTPVLWMLTVFFHPGAEGVPRSTTRKIDRSLSIAAETSLNSNRAIFPLKSRAKNFDGSTVGFRPSEEIFFAYKSARYAALRGSSGSDGEGCGVAWDRAAYWLRCCPSDRSRWASNGTVSRNSLDLALALGLRLDESESRSGCPDLVRRSAASR
jgi:hypothetical protein